MAGYASAKPRVAVSMQIGTLSFVTAVDLCSKINTALRQSILSHAHITRSHICSHGNGGIFTVLTAQNIFVYLAMSHTRKVISPVSTLAPSHYEYN